MLQYFKYDNTDLSTTDKLSNYRLNTNCLKLDDPFMLTVIKLNFMTKKYIYIYPKINNIKGLVIIIVY